MAPRDDDLPTPDEFAADRIPDVPEVAPKPFTMHAPTLKAFSMSGRPSADPAWGSGNSYASTANTQQVQDTGLGPANTNPAADQPTDPNRKPSPFTEVGASGLAQYGGFVRDEFLPQLQGDRGLRVFREMYDNDPIVGSLVFMIQMLMRKVEWRVEPPESPTVEGIVAARQRERTQMLAAKNADKQQQMMLAQAGIAGKAQGSSFTAQSPTGATIGGQGPPPPKPGAASPLSEPATPFHQPVPGLEGKTSPPGPQSTGPQPGTTPSPQTTSPSSSSSGSPSATPPSQPGANAQPNRATSPLTNYPARPNSPTANPSGGPNQQGALTGMDGLPGDRPRGLAQPSDPSTDTDIGGMPKIPLNRVKKEWEDKFEQWWDSREHETVQKASGSSGAGAGGIDAIDVGQVPTDPETDEPMDFPIGTGPEDPPSPEEQHAMELAVFVETALHDLSDSWADTISQIVTMIVYGFALHELVYKKRNGPNPDDPIQGSRFADGRIGWAKIAGRAQETRHRWEFDEFGNVLGMWQLAPPKFQLKYIPLSKALLFRTTGYKQNPEGRALALDTPIPTPAGWRIMADLVEGDTVFDEQGRIRYVTATATWEDRPTYRITFSDGTTIDADANHEWMTTKVYERSLKKPALARTTEAIAATVKTPAGVSDHAVGWAKAVQYPRQQLVVDPYVLGLWLGDGTTISGQIATNLEDSEVEAGLIAEAGYTTKVLSNGAEGCLGRQIQVYGLSTDLRSAGVLGDKHVPLAFLRGDIEQRTALLSGLMDSDGTVDADGRCEFTNTNMNLVDGVAELVRSLGCGAKMSLRKRANGTSHKQDSWCVKFTPLFVPFRLPRKLARVKSIRARQHHYIVSVERIENQTTKCIEVDSPSHLFLAGESFIPTHNSILRSAYRPWYFKRRIEEIEAIGVERDLAGLPIAYVPYQMMSPYATPEETAALNEVKLIVKNVRRDEQDGLVFPAAYDPDSHQPMFKFELLSSPSRRQFDTDKIITRYDQRIAMVALIDFILLGHETVGSKALADTKVDLFTTALESWLNVIADVFNTSAIPRLMQINGEDPAMSPRLAFGKLTRVSLVEIAQLITSMAGAGADLFPDAALEDFLREAGGLPAKSATDDL